MSLGTHIKNESYVEMIFITQIIAVYQKRPYVMFLSYVWWQGCVELSNSVRSAAELRKSLVCLLV